MAHTCFAVVAIVACFVILGGASPVAVTKFNEWLLQGQRRANSAVELELTPLDDNSLRLAAFASSTVSAVDDSADESPTPSAVLRMRLPLKSHVLGEDFIVNRSYAKILTQHEAQRRKAAKGSKRTIDDVLNRLTFALMVEFALWDVSPIRPWCRLLIEVQQGVGLSNSPLLWPTELLEEIEPRFTREAIVARRKKLQASFNEASTQDVLKELTQFVHSEKLKPENDNLGNHGEFKLLSVKNYMRSRILVELLAVSIPTGGVALVPIANFLQYAGAPAFRPVSDDAPLLRHLETSTFVESGFWTLTLPRRSVMHSRDGLDLSELQRTPMVVDLSRQVSIESYFSTFGRLPSRPMWNTSDCQLVLFSRGLSQERNDVKRDLSIVMDAFVHHYSCLRFGEDPVQGLVGALMSEIPATTPPSAVRCMKDAVERIRPVDDEKMSEQYEAMISCLESASWSNLGRDGAFLCSHIDKLKVAVAAFQREQFSAQRNDAADTTLLASYLEGAQSTPLEKVSSVTLRRNRRRILVNAVMELDAKHDSCRRRKESSDDRIEL